MKCRICEIGTATDLIHDKKYSGNLKTGEVQVCKSCLDDWIHYRDDALTQKVVDKWKKLTNSE